MDHQAQTLVHGHPGTPFGDSFPLGNRVLGDGSSSSIRPIRAGNSGVIPHMQLGPSAHTYIYICVCICHR